ncbi:MAG: DNA-binding NarL/FixJ family response regulator [Candidatus Azotimanducaceae bacterium]
MKVLSVDDHLLFSEGLRIMIAGFSETMEFIHAANCAAALDISADGMETVLLDYHLPDVQDFEALVSLREHFPGAKIVVVSGEESADVIRQAISLGAAGYIPKSSTPDILIAALQLVFAGGTYLPPHVLEVASENPNEPEPSLLDALSERQKSVLRAAIQGKMNKVIAAELNIAEGTVKAHLSAAFRALGARNRTEAVFISTRLNLNFD